jgi:hypothetical protein
LKAKQDTTDCRRLSNASSAAKVDFGLHFGSFFIRKASANIGARALAGKPPNLLERPDVNTVNTL